MICIHPKVASSTNSLQRLQFETGLRAVIGNKYARLIGSTKPRPAPKAPQRTWCVHPMTQCTFCERRTNAQCPGDDCYRCKKGVMATLPTPTGSDAA